MADLANIEQLLEAFLPAWRRWLRVHLWQLRHDHEDIIQEASAELIELNPSDVRNLAGLGFAIMKNKAIDRFRKQALRVASDIELKDDHPDPASDIPETLHYREQLHRALGFIAGLPASDRDLLIRGAAARETNELALSTAERKKLQRLRMDLRRELNRKRSPRVRRE